MSEIVRKREKGEPVMLRNGDSIIVAEARIGAIVNFPVLEDPGHGYVARMYEKYVRSPGSRIIAYRDGTIYLQKEARIEGDKDWDWRLPGGKVIDSFKSYKAYLDTPLPESIVLEAAHRELQEEAGLDAGSLTLFDKKICGTTVEWDLYYVVAKDLSEHQSDGAHEEGEEMQESGWFSFDQVLQMCRTGEIGEGRTVAALLQFMHQEQS